jgi:hypothetical protein
LTPERDDFVDDEKQRVIEAEKEPLDPQEEQVTPNSQVYILEPSEDPPAATEVKPDEKLEELHDLIESSSSEQGFNLCSLSNTGKLSTFVHYD